MNQAIRCTVTDQYGHRCNRKDGHTKIAPTSERPKDVRNHRAFGREWAPADPLVSSRKRRRKAAA